MAVGDVGAVSFEARRRRDTSGGVDGRGAGRECKPGLVFGLRRTEQDAAIEPRWHGIGVDDGTRFWHGGCSGLHRPGEGGAHGMRGDGVAVGDIGSVSCGARYRRDAASGDDGRGARRKRKPGLVGGLRITARHAEREWNTQPRWHGIGVDDGARIGNGIGIIYSAGEGRAHGMRGHGVDISNVGAVSCGARGRRITTGGDNDRGTGGKRDAGVVGRHTRTEQDAAIEPRLHGIGVDDGSRIGHGGGGVLSAGKGGTHGMRGDGVGVGVVGAVSCGARGRRDTVDDDDGRDAGRNLEPRMVGGHGSTQQDAACEPRWLGISFDDGTWIWNGGGRVHGAGEGGAHGMRGDGVAVGDFGAVSCGARGSRDTSDVDDGRGAWGKHDAGVVGGHSRAEQDAASEPRRHGIGVDHRARIEHGGGGAYSAGEGGAHGMRGDGMAVGDVGAVSCGSRGSRDAAGGDDGRVARRERDAGVVDGHSKTQQVSTGKPS
jgi:hypothetical protein